MRLEDVLRRNVPPEPWVEGDKIPWHDPEFSRRMLREHLSQAHDLASRRSSVIDQHVAWIHRSLLDESPSRVLDLGCGPGLYTTRLAELGHECVGIDFSPAAIDYAGRQTSQQERPVAYYQGDIRAVDYGAGYNLVMLIFGEFNMFSPNDASDILRKVRRALIPGGLLLLEAHTHDCVSTMGRAGTSWRTSEGGLFSDKPHLVLTENFWHEQGQATTRRTFVIDIESSAVDRYVETTQAYDVDAYARVLQEAGLIVRDTYPVLPGSPSTGEFVVLVARAV